MPTCSTCQVTATDDDQIANVFGYRHYLNGTVKVWGQCKACRDLDNATRTIRREAEALTFGVEIETYGLTRRQAATVVAEALGTNRVEFQGTYYDVWAAIDSEGRAWKVMSDASIQAPIGEGAEIVTPPLRFDEIETLQTVVRALRMAGARTNESCGMHVHVGAAGLDAKALVRLVKNMKATEDLAFRAFAVADRRANSWCKKVDGEFVARLDAETPDHDGVARAWYCASQWHGEARFHYSHTRYRALNLHNLWYRNGNARNS